MFNHESETIELMSKVMDVTTLRHQVLADNLANANTPNFIRSDLDFQSQLTQAIDSGDKSQLQGVTPVVQKDHLSPMSPDGNNVSVQKELGGMMENQLLYNFSARILDRKFNGLRKAISGN